MPLKLPLFVIAYVSAMLFLIGTVMGSFCYCWALRILTGEKISKGRSHCRSCDHVLGPLDLVPLFSWLFLKGKCRYCGEKIPASYPLAEAAMAVSYVAVFLCSGWRMETLQYLCLTTVLLCICYTDLESFLIPDRFIVLGLAIRAVFLALGLGNLKNSLIGAFSISLPVLLLVLIMDRILKKDSMGGGDLKLLFMTGSYFSWTQNLLALFIASLAGIFMGLYFQKHPRKTALAHSEEEEPAEGQFPFGPAIALGTLVSMCIGEPIIRWYLGLWGM